MKTQKTFFEQMGGTYEPSGDVLLPVLSIEESPSIGKYCRMRKSYLKAHRPALYSNLLLAGKLFQHLSELDQSCEDRMARIIRQMAKNEGVTETLKAADQMAWVAHMNSVRSRAEEIVLSELIYAKEVSRC